MSLYTRGLKHQQKIAEWEERIQKLHEKYPRLEEVARQFAHLALELARVEAGEKKPGGVGREELIKKQAALQEEKKALLQEYRLPPNIYDIWWECEICQDTGFAGIGEKCSCLKKEEIKARLHVSGLAPKQSEQVFENFSLDWYEDKERYRGILEQGRIFADRVSRRQPVDNLLVYGPVGTGKTHLCSAIANAVLQAGKQVIYLKISLLLDLLRGIKFNGEKSEHLEKKRSLESLYRVDLLIIDDLGTESLTDFAQEQLLLLLDERLNYNLPWVISTNLSPNELDAQYELRLMDRIMGSSKTLRFTGESVRRLKKLSGKN